MNKSLLKLPAGPLLTLLLVWSLGMADAWAIAGQAATGAQAATLENQADALAADIDKVCQKATGAARAVCREQQARAVQRLRARAARLR